MVPLLRVITQIFDDIKTHCLSLEVSEDDAPVLWLALRVCWNCGTVRFAYASRRAHTTFTHTLCAMPARVYE
jgi:hypothetical protein